MRLKKAFALILVILLILLGTSCSPPQQENNKSGKVTPITKTEFLMGTIAKITIYDELIDEKVIEMAFERIEEIENKMTINKVTEKSEIIKLNNNAGKETVKLSPDTFFVVEKGKYYSKTSNGKFDITIGPIVKLWNIDTETTIIPEDKLIENKLPLVNYDNLLLDKDTNTAELLQENMIVDLGAIAKGYAADEAAKILKKEGIEHGIINLGGNILTIGKKPDGSLWRLGLQDPNQPRGKYMGIVKLNDQALVSSGTYEKYFEVDGKKYHHIIDPQTGYPAETNLASVSIITKNSIDADGLSTTIFLLGLKEGMGLIEEMDNTEAIFITNDKKVYISSGVDTDIFTIENKDFKLEK